MPSTVFFLFFLNTLNCVAAFGSSVLGHVRNSARDTTYATKKPENTNNIPNEFISKPSST